MKKNNLSIEKLFSDHNIKKDDDIMIHGDSGIIQQLGRSDKFKFFFDSIIRFLGRNGTVLIPAFSYSFCKKKIFNPKRNPSEVGLFSEIFRLRKDTKRTNHPIFSFSIFGKNWKIYEKAKTQSCFGKGTVFDVFRHFNGKIITMGTTFENSATFLHYIEETALVNYRYHKKFFGKIINKGNKELINTNFYVRKRKFNKEFKKPPPYLKYLKKTEFGRYNVYSINSKKFYNICIKKLKSDPNYLVN